MVERKRFLLRIPEPLWEELRKWAAAELRSVNGQIEFLLQQAVDRRRRDRSAGAEGVDESTSDPPPRGAVRTPSSHPGCKSWAGPVDGETRAAA